MSKFLLRVAAWAVAAHFIVPPSFAIEGPGRSRVSPVPFRPAPPTIKGPTLISGPVRNTPESPHEPPDRRTFENCMAVLRGVGSLGDSSDRFLNRMMSATVYDPYQQIVGEGTQLFESRFQTGLTVEKYRRLLEDTQIQSARERMLSDRVPRLSRKLIEALNRQESSLEESDRRVLRKRIQNRFSDWLNGRVDSLMPFLVARFPTGMTYVGFVSEIQKLLQGSVADPLLWPGSRRAAEHRKQVSGMLADVRAYFTLVGLGSFKHLRHLVPEINDRVYWEINGSARGSFVKLCFLLMFHDLGFRVVDMAYRIAPVGPPGLVHPGAIDFVLETPGHEGRLFVEAKLALEGHKRHEVADNFYDEAFLTDEISFDEYTTFRLLPRGYHNEHVDQRRAKLQLAKYALFSHFELMPPDRLVIVSSEQTDTLYARIAEKLGVRVHSPHEFVQAYLPVEEAR